MAEWPASLPDFPTTELTITPQRNVVSFEPEVGPSIDRRRGTAAGKIYSVRLPPITKTQFAAFQEFFEDTLGDGVLPFDHVDPITGTEYEWKFNGEPYSARPLSGGDDALVEVSFTLMRLP